jgi:hypothetical protein
MRVMLIILTMILSSSRSHSPCAVRRVGCLEHIFQAAHGNS